MKNEAENPNILEDLPELPEEPEEYEDDTTDWKAEALKRQGIAKRYKSKFEKLAEKVKSKEESKLETKQPEEEEKKDKLDIAQKSYLLSNGIKKEEFDFILETMNDTGKSIDDLLESKWFKSELEDKREELKTKEAIPSGSERSSSSARTEVDYWIAKGELPADRELRSKVVKEKRKRASSASQFSDNPIV